MSTVSQFKTLSLLLMILLLPVARAGAHPNDPNEEAHGHATEPSYYLAEHGDFGIGFEEGQFHPHIHLHAGAIVDGNALDDDAGFDPDTLIVVVTHQAEVLRPAGQMWDSLGLDVNEPLWVLPQHEKENLPAFGLATEEVPAGLFVDDLVTLHLRHLKGPGDLGLWTDDAFGLPTFLLSTHDQRLEATLPVGLHAHCNWGFTQPGTYTTVFEVTGDLVAGGSTRAWAILTFLVSEKPLPLATLAGDADGDGTVDENDLLLVEENLGRTVPVWPGPDNQ